MSRANTLLITLTLLATGLAGCIGTDEIDTQSAGGLTDAFDTSRGWSMPLTPAKYAMLPGIEEIISSFDGTAISMGLFFPDVEGCDWEADDLPPACRLPVVMDAGPYYADHVDADKYRPPIIEWLVPRGYVVAQMSIRGTGASAGCMEFMSMNEQKDVDAMVTWLGEQPWSSGNVGMMGRSYDGTTPLMAAAFGNAYLKTIVPISGVASVPDMMFKNGTSELRGPIMHSAVYWGFYGVGADDGGAPGHRAEHLVEQACAETASGQANGLHASATGDVSDSYWQDRDFRSRINENYQGSIWIVHGMEDWNVNPSQVVPWINELQDAGVPTRAWLGQWAHAYPDRMDEHRNVRWDWAQETLEWFDYYLKGEGNQPPLDVEVEDSLYVWRTEASYPPRDVVWQDVDVAVSDAVAANAPMTYTTEPIEGDLRIAGLPRLHVEATPTTATGGYLFAELYDVFPDGRSARVGWGAIDLRYHAGGNTDPATLTPGMPVIAKMQFEPTDAHIGDGHRLRVVIHKDGVEDINPSPDPSAVVISGATLSLPTVERSSALPGYSPPVSRGQALASLG